MCLFLAEINYPPNKSVLLLFFIVMVTLISSLFLLYLRISIAISFIEQTLLTRLKRSNQSNEFKSFVIVTNERGISWERTKFSSVSWVQLPYSAVLEIGIGVTNFLAIVRYLHSVCTKGLFTFFVPPTRCPMSLSAYLKFTLIVQFFYPCYVNYSYIRQLEAKSG